MNILAISGIAIVATVLSIVLKKHNAEYSIFLSLITCLLIIGLVISKVSPAVIQIKGLIASAGMPLEYALILFKTLGICFITQFASDCCRDAGESALATKVELAGKITILLISLPLFEKIATTASKLIGGS